MVEVLEKCPACSAELRPKAVFCHRCGRPLPEASVTFIPHNGKKPAQSVSSDDEDNGKTQLAPEIVSEPVEAATADQVEPEEIKVEKARDVKVKAEETKIEELKAEEPQPETIENPAAEKPLIVAEPETAVSEVPLEPIAVDEETIVKPAVPRKSKRFVSRTEYVWEESAAPTWRVMLFSIIALGVVLLLVWMNNYLR